MVTRLMELAGLFLLLLLPASDASGELASAIETSLHHELGDVRVAIAPDTLVTPAMVQGKDAPMRARFLAQVIWGGADEASVTVVPTGLGADKRVTRTLRFAKEDASPERGRAIGLVIAELLRESPPSLWMTASSPPTGLDATAAPPHLVLGAMLAMEKIGSGPWATGPALSYDFHLSPTLSIGATGTALFASTNQYAQFGLGIGLGWNFLHSSDHRHGLGIVGALSVRRESLTVSYREYTRSAAPWTGAAAAVLRGYVSAWRHLRVVAQAHAGTTFDALSVTVGNARENEQTTVTYGRFRPGFAIGLEYAL
jgi:hypothetical protein